MGPLEDSMPTIVELLDKIWPSNWEPKNLANSHPQTVEKYTPTQKRHPKVTLHIFRSLDPRIQGRQILANGDWKKIERSVQVNKHHSKKTATLKLVSLRHNPPPSTPFSPLIPFPFPTLPAQLPSTFHTLNSTGPLGALLGAGLGVFATATFPVFFSSQRTENVCHKNHRNFGVFQSRVVCFKMSESYMGVSLNGGTPKTPQNDHF